MHSSVFDHTISHGVLYPVLADNYRAVHKLPTKKEEKDFVYNLKPSEKTYTIFNLKSPEQLFNSGDWEGVAYNEEVNRSWLQKFFLYLAYKCS